MGGLGGALRKGVIRTVVMAMFAGVATVSTVTVGAGTAAAAENLRCDVLYSVNNGANKAKWVDPVTGNATDAFELKPKDSDHNQLGIGPGGTYAIYTSGDGKIYKYDAANGTTSSTDRDSKVAKTTHGAINPANGLYYYGGKDDRADSFTFGAYDPANNTSLDVVLKVTFDKKTTVPGGNGDLAFDANGNLFIVAAGDEKGRIYSVPGPMPTSSLKTLTGKAITDESKAFRKSNSIAFGPNGYLFVGGGGSLLKVDPSTGNEVPANLTSSPMTDMGSCNDPNTIELRKNLPDGRVGKDDQFGLEISGGGLSEGNTATTSGTKTGIQEQAAGPVLGLAGKTYTLTETAQGGASLDNYVTTWECVDAKTQTKKSGEGATITVEIPAGQSGKSTSCTFTNAAKKPGLELVKSASPNTAADFVVGKTVTYSFKMTNTGAVTLKDVKPVEKTFTGKADMSDFTCPDGAKSLAPKASVTCTATYVLQQEDIDRGKLDNTATATGTDPGGKPVNSNESSVPLVGGPATPGITLDKIASPKEAEAYKLGQTIKYTFKISNTGNVTLNDLKVNEGDFTGNGKLSAVDCPVTSVAPGGTVTCTAEYTLTQADIDSGRIENTATATGKPPAGEPITSPPDTETLEGNPAKSLSIVKDASPSTTESYKVGQEIDYTFKITNTGEVTLTDVHPNETKFTGDGDMSAFDCPAGAKSLAPGESTTCTAKYTLTQADIDAGKLENTATATGTPPSGEPVTSKPSGKTLSGEPKPAISLEKTATPTEADKFAVGETVTYSFTMTNTGNVTLTDVHPNEVTFSGDKTKLSDFVCPDASKPLAPNASTVCTATYELTQADVDRGTLDNTATATGTPPSGGDVTSEPDDVNLSGNQKPALEIVKTASPKGVEDFKVGQEITYTFDITNTGNQTLSNVKVAEGAFSGSGKITDLSCPEEATSMAPGAKVTCSAKYTITQDDVNAGKIDNVAIATGTPPGTETPIESPQDEENLAGDPKSGLTLEKTAEPRENVQVGDTVTYKFAITNTGDQTLTEVKVKENEFSGTGTLSDITCPDNSLDPGESVTCEATYTFTDEDMKAGSIDNVATATGTPPSKAPIESNPSDATVTAGEQPGGTGSLGSLGLGSLGSLGSGSLAAGSLAAGSLAAGSLAAGSLENSGSQENAGSAGSSGSAGSQENSGSAGSGSGNPGTPGGNPGTPGGNPGTPANPGTPGDPGTPGNAGNSGNGNAGNGGAAGNSDTEKGALIDSGLGADGDGGLNTGLVAGGLALLVAAAGVLFMALRRRKAAEGDVTDL
ncbi:hypothetical protein AB4Z09_15535 [Rhodococcus sp. TAF43]|uniref:DUF7507 domain-containing protein n=1 Tax=Rhodococcus sp. TAF43 TaxID=3237483 RepID=UPI003F95A475